MFAAVVTVNTFLSLSNERVVVIEDVRARHTNVHVVRDRHSI